jgi:hypothetical protein
MKPDLFVHRSTLNCAVQSKCIVCLHKLLPYLPENEKFSQVNFCIPANKRPETCPRSSDSPIRSETIGLYDSSSRTLTIGDGDFSFSLSLANSALSLPNLVATSYETRKTLESVYPSVSDTLIALKLKEVFVLHQIDGSQLDSISVFEPESFDIIVWNFPCVGITDGADGQVADIPANQTLIRSFFAGALTLLKPEG